MILSDFGFSSNMVPKNASGIPARVTAVLRDRFEVVCEHGLCMAQLKTAAYRAGGELYPTTGDYVMLEWGGGGVSLILSTLARRTYFQRLDPSSSGHYAQAVAANFDYVFVLQSLNHDFNPRRLERYLSLAWQSGSTPVVVLTKADLCADWRGQEQAAASVAPGTAICVLSAMTGFGLDALRAYLRPGATVVLLGSSGVGKSSLLNALAGTELMPTGDIREDDSRGRHTTTHRQLVMLPTGVMVIDTPGMRELGLWDADSGISQSFTDVESYESQCRFSNCRHENEPGCAVKEAIARGELSKERWQRYLHLKKEDRHADARAARKAAKIAPHTSARQRRNARSLMDDPQE